MIVNAGENSLLLAQTEKDGYTFAKAPTYSTGNHRMDQQLLPAFVDPDAPDVTPIVELHRGHMHGDKDGFVTFHRIEKDGKWIDLFSLPAKQLNSNFPHLAPLLDRDSYFSINSMWRSHYGKSEYSPPAIEPALKPALRNSESLRYLTACFVDIDCHNLGISVGEAIGAVINAQDAGDIPPASMMFRSGRGVWCFWFLVDRKNTNRLQGAYSEKKRLWGNIQRVIGDRFIHIGADAAARDLPRVTRVPGSINSKSATRVDYWIQGSSKGERFVYTLDQLASSFGVELPVRHRAVISKAHQILSERGRNGQRGRWVKSREQFEQLWEMRGGFAEGTRGSAVYVYATILRSQRIAENVVTEEVYRLFRDFNQAGSPYSENQLKMSLKTVDGFKFGGITNQHMSNLLKVTSEEAALLETWKAAGTTPEEPTGLTRSERRSKRRVLIQKLIVSMDQVPTLRQIKDWLGNHDLDAAPATVASDLKSLKIDNPRSAKRKARKRARSRQRKLLK